MKCFVGIDIGKSKHDYAVVDSSGGIVKTGEFSSNVGGYKKLNKVLSKFDIIQIGMEATGHYWRNLWQALVHDGYNMQFTQSNIDSLF